VLGERTAFFGSSQLMVFGGHDDGLRTYYNDAWLLRVKTETKADHERTEWYWQSTDLDGDADDNMQIPERRDGAGMVYLPSYVDFLSVTNTWSPGQLWHLVSVSSSGRRINIIANYQNQPTTMARLSLLVLLLFFFSATASAACSSDDCTACQGTRRNATRKRAAVQSTKTKALTVKRALLPFS
jgi:hypothetical protein